MKLSPLALFLIPAVAAAAATATADKWVYPNVPWPLPQHMTAGKQTVVLASAMTLSCAADCDMAACAANSTLASAVHRYVPILSPAGAPPPGSAEIIVSKIEICVIDAKELLGPAMNESHSLSVPGADASSSRVIRIDAASQHGTLRALESLAHTI